MQDLENANNDHDHGQGRLTALAARDLSLEWNWNGMLHLARLKLTTLRNTSNISSIFTDSVHSDLLASVQFKQEAMRRYNSDAAQESRLGSFAVC